MALYHLCFDPATPAAEENHTIGSYILGAGGDVATTTTIGSSEALDVNIAGGSLTVTESDVYAEDSAHTSGDDLTFVGAVRQDTAGSLVDADGDYSGLQVDACGYLRVRDCAEKDIASAAVAASDTATSVTAGLAGRNYVHLRNMGNSTAYIGGAGVTEATGFPIGKKDGFSLKISDAVDLQVVTTAGGAADIRVLETA